MSDWEETTTAELISSGLLKIGDGYRAKNSELVSDGLPFARAGNINNGFNFSGADCLPKNYLDVVGEKISNAGDTVFTSKGTVGRFAFVSDVVERFVYSPQLCYWRSLNHRMLEPKFVYYWMHSKEFLGQVEGLKGQTDMADYVNLADQRKMVITIPQPKEQKAIASVLSSLDDKIDLLHRQNKTLEAMAETLFRQWFVEEAGDWEEESFSDFADHLKINIKPAIDPLKLFTYYSLPAFDQGMRPTIETGNKILSNKYEVQPWTILVSKLNPRFPRIWPIGDAPGENAICSTEFQVFKPKNRNLFGYLYFFLKSNAAREELIMAASGTSGSHQRVRPEDISNLWISLPSIELAEDYSVLVMPSVKKMMANHVQILKLEKLRDTLLPKLMSGEVRVV